MTSFPDYLPPIPPASLNPEDIQTIKEQNYQSAKIAYEKSLDIKGQIFWIILGIFLTLLGLGFGLIMIIIGIVWGIIRVSSRPKAYQRYMDAEKELNNSD